MTFEDCLQIVLEYEGGHVDDPNDPGGETKFGISQRAYPKLNIGELTEKDAAVIYFNDYWAPCWCDKLSEELRLLVFDTAVNMGVKRSVRMLQRSTGVQKLDGRMGPKTYAAVESTPSTVIIDTFTSMRFDHYAKLKNWHRYGKGWAKRLLQVALISAFNISTPIELNLD